MKRVLTYFALAITLFGFSQKDFNEGVLTIQQKFSTDSDDYQIKAMIAQMGDLTTKAYVKNTKTRAEVDNEMSGKMVMITDSQSMEMLMLMDNPQMGKIYMTQNLTPTEEALNSLKVEVLDDTKTILGYECKHYKITMAENGKENIMELYATDKIQGIVTQQTAMFGGKFKAFPLWIKMNLNQMGMNLTAISEVVSISEAKLSDDLFNMTPPEGYKNMGQ